ncbi:MAG: hypothetical protein HFH09_02480 [Bacilli bacterium]|jgi:5'-nucleotidase|nr:hypothetical protein [Bacilli bacterium]
MKTIMVDMDEVLCIGGHLGIVNKFLNTSYKVEDLPGYYTEDMLPKERLQEYYQFFKTENPYQYAEIIPDAREVLEKLSKKYQLLICTAYYSDVYDMEQSHCLIDKYKWLQQNFPFISPYQYIFINDKSLLNCDIKIDDRLSNLKGYGEQKYLFDSYHNQEICDEELEKEGVIRVSGWKELETILLKEE